MTILKGWHLVGVGDTIQSIRLENFTTEWPAETGTEIFVTGDGEVIKVRRSPGTVDIS